MSGFDIFSIAGSAMSAESVRLNVTASNLANAQSVGSSEATTYRARSPVFASMVKAFQEPESGYGVQVKGVVEIGGPLQQQYRPDHPLANEQGYIFLPNVNVADEMANMIAASRAYQTNVEVLNTSKQMILATLRLGR
ncbi:MAG TPA: flagellar basal body rod protein FlgC [Gammaproteobacteria bacterium]|nr:flagellar basal body rod protein FlgC [Gammaproteobacteria bacterium]